MSLLISGGRIGDFCRFIFADSVTLAFSFGISSLVLAFGLVFVQGSVCFISFEYILLTFSWNVGYSFILKSNIFSISFFFILIDWHDVLGFLICLWAILAYVLVIYRYQQFSWLLEKVYSLCVLHALFPFPSCKTQGSLKRQRVVHANLHTLHIRIQSLCGLDLFHHTSYILDVLYKCLCDVQIFDTWSTAGGAGINCSTLFIVYPILIYFGTSGLSKVSTYVWVCIISLLLRMVIL